MEPNIETHKLDLQYGEYCILLGKDDLLFKYVETIYPFGRQ